MSSCTASKAQGVTDAVKMRHAWWTDDLSPPAEMNPYIEAIKLLAESTLYSKLCEVSSPYIYDLYIYLYYIPVKCIETTLLCHS